MSLLSLLKIEILNISKKEVCITEKPQVSEVRSGDAIRSTICGVKDAIYFASG